MKLGRILRYCETDIEMAIELTRGKSFGAIQPLVDAALNYDPMRSETLLVQILENLKGDPSVTREQRRELLGFAMDALNEVDAR